MRRNLILIISMGLNLSLGLAWLASRHHTHAEAQVPESQPAGTNLPHTHVVVRKQFFSWQELETPDYAAYVINLREIGCPEQTIRDIIIADVNQLYARKRLADVVTPDQQWWRAEPDTNLVATASAKILALDQERRALLTTLLGLNWDAPATPVPSFVALNGPVLGELSPEAKRSVQDLLTRSQQRTQVYLDAQKAAGKPPDPAEMARLGQQTRNELAQLLNPAQMEEFLLRYSQNAAALREQLRGVAVTPDEFRKLFRLSDPIEQQLQLTSGDAGTQAATQAALGSSLLEALKSVLGPERYQAYRLAQDPVYRDSVAQAQASPDVSTEATKTLYELNKATVQEQNRIRNDAGLTAAQKTEQLKNVQSQLQAASDQLLGLSPVPPSAPPVPSEPGPTQVYPYSSGESIDMIAARFGVPASSILSANPNVNFNNLTRGTPINIPRSQ